MFKFSAFPCRQLVLIDNVKAGKEHPTIPFKNPSPEHPREVCVGAFLVGLGRPPSFRLAKHPTQALGQREWLALPKIFDLEKTLTSC